MANWPRGHSPVLASAAAWLGARVCEPAGPVEPDPRHWSLLNPVPPATDCHGDHTGLAVSM